MSSLPSGKSYFTFPLSLDKTTPKKLIFSCNLFNGYTTEMNVSPTTTALEIVQFAKISLESFLKYHNLNVLMEKFKRIKNNYHIHDYSPAMDPIYICCHRTTDMDIA